MVCGQCTSTPEITCSTIYPVLSPCACDDAAPIRVEGPDGQKGPTGATPKFTIGTVAGGGASITILSPDDFDRVMDWVLPAVPEGMAYEWTERNTFTLPSIFEMGILTNGGTTIFGGTGFLVTPDAIFSASVDTASNCEVDGDVGITGDANINGNLSVQGATTLGSVIEDGNIRLGADTTVALSTTTDYVAGKVVLQDCGKPLLGKYLGSSTYVNANATGLVPVNPGDPDSVICDDIVINVPVSTCIQATPTVRIKVRVGYYTGSTPNGTIILRLWEPAIAGTQTDGFIQGDVINAQAGFLYLIAQVTLAVGNNHFQVSMENNCGEIFTPTQVTYWVSNT